LIETGRCGKLIGRKARHERLVGSWADGPYPFDRSARGAPDSGRDALPRRMKTRSDAGCDSPRHPFPPDLHTKTGNQTVGQVRSHRMSFRHWCPAWGRGRRWAGQACVGITGWRKVSSRCSRTSVFTAPCCHKITSLRRHHPLYRRVLQQSMPTLRARLSPAQRSPLRLSAATIGSLEESANSAVRNTRSSSEAVARAGWFKLAIVQKSVV
jgi:hypothetical protein